MNWGPPVNHLVLYFAVTFWGISGEGVDWPTMVPRVASLSDSCTPDRCSFYNRVHFVFLERNSSCFEYLQINIRLCRFYLNSLVNTWYTMSKMKINLCKFYLNFLLNKFFELKEFITWILLRRFTNFFSIRKINEFFLVINNTKFTQKPFNGFYLY